MRRTAHAKTEFIAFRATPEEARRLRQIRTEIGAGSMSEALRWLVGNHTPAGMQQPAVELRAEAAHG